MNFRIIAFFRFTSSQVLRDVLHKKNKRYFKRAQIYINKYQTEQDRKIANKARKMRKNNIILDIFVNYQGVTMVQKNNDSRLVSVTEMSKLQELANDS